MLDQKSDEGQMSRPIYPSDLSDEEWAVVSTLLPEHKRIGSPRRVDLREILNAQFYVLDNGSSSELFPMTFRLGKRSTVTSVAGVNGDF